MREVPGHHHRMSGAVRPDVPLVRGKPGVVDAAGRGSGAHLRMTTVDDLSGSETLIEACSSCGRSGSATSGAWCGSSSGPRPPARSAGRCTAADQPHGDAAGRDPRLPRRDGDQVGGRGRGRGLPCLCRRPSGVAFLRGRRHRPVGGRHAGARPARRAERLPGRGGRSDPVPVLLRRGVVAGHGRTRRPPARSGTRDPAADPRGPGGPNLLSAKDAGLPPLAEVLGAAR